MEYDGRVTDYRKAAIDAEHERLLRVAGRGAGRDGCGCISPEVARQRRELQAAVERICATGVFRIIR